MRNDKLAIVIPFYKSIFFEKTLESLANQTCRDFNVYIGDDCSPDIINDILKQYVNRINIVYKRFNENFGGRDLVAQWERCIDLVEDEEWIWLFSDDDIMDTSCVERFYLEVENHTEFDIFHYNVFQIDEQENIINKYTPFPSVLLVEDFLKYRLKGIINSYVVEYIFRKSHFLLNGRVPNFDLAWGSDDALWLKLGKDKGIKTIENVNIYWRSSQHNISPNTRDHQLLNRKLYAKINFLIWVSQQVHEKGFDIEVIESESLLENAIIKDLKIYCLNLSFSAIKDILNKFYSHFRNYRFKKLKLLCLYCYKSTRHIVFLIRKCISK